MKEMISNLKLCEKIIRFGKETPEQTAFLYYEGKTLCSVSRGEVFHRVSACREHFARMNIRRAGILGTNSWQWACNAWGMIAAGITVAFLDPLLSLEDLTNAVRRTDLELLVVEPELVQLGKMAQERLPELEAEVFYDTEEGGESAEWGEWEEGDIIFFTSGTSRNSKAVVTPTLSIEGHAKAQLQLILHDAKDVVLHPLPFHHSYGFAKLNFYYEADCPVFISSMKSLLRDAKRAGADRMVLVPSAVEFLLKKKAFTPQLKSILVAGSYFPESLAESVRQLGIAVQNQYGSSELPCGIGDSLPQDEVNTITLHSFVKIEIAEDGEIVVDDPFHMKEYYKEPELTEEVLADGKVHTGDAGYLDREGRLHLLGRKKDIILMENGEKVFCQDVDAALSALTGVREGAVIYVNKHLVAVLVPKEGQSKEGLEEAIAGYNQSQPYYRRIREIWIYGTDLPYTSSGKLHRSRLETEYRQENCQKQVGRKCIGI